MHSGHDPKDDLTVLEKMGYDTRDIAAERIAKIIGQSAVIVLILFLASFLTIFGVERFTGQKIGPAASEPLEPFRRMPADPYPLVQSNRTAWRDMIEVKQNEKAKLNSYGPSETGEASRMPIDKAIAETAAEGLPTRAGAGAEDPR